MGVEMTMAGSEFVALGRTQLKEAGMRITGPRIQILEALAATNRPLNAYALHAQIKAAGGAVDVVSVYRTLSVLSELGLVHFIPSADGFLPCTGVCEHDNQTEHLVCDDCGSVTEISIPACTTKDLEEQLQESGFQAREVRIEVLGTCNKCQAKTG